MSESLHNMDDLFKKALQDNTDVPPESVWENIDKSLDKKSVVSILKKYNKLKWVAALLILFTSAMAVYTLHVRTVNRQLANANNMMKQKKSENKKPGIDHRPVDSVTAGGGNTIIIKRENQDPQESRKESLPLGLPNHQKTPAVTKSAKMDTKRQNEAINLVSAVKQRNEQKQKLPANKLNNQTVQYNPLQPQASENINGESAGVPNNTTVQNKIDTKENTIADAGTPDAAETLQDKSSFGTETTRVKSIRNGSLTVSFANNISSIEPQVQPILSPGAQILKDKNFNYRANRNRSVRLNFNNPSRLSFNIFYSPDVSFKTVSNNHPMYRDEDRDEIRNQEWVKYASTIGLHINYDLKNNWQVSTGISYSTVSTEILPKTIYARQDNNGNLNFRMNCSAGYTYIDPDGTGGIFPVPGDSIESLSSNNKLSYINIPITVRYAFTKNRWSIAPSAGMEISFLSKGQIETTIATNTGSKNTGTATVQGLKKNYLSATISLLGQYKLNKNIAISFEPTSRFGLEPINKDASVNTILNSIGFAAGLVIKL